MKTHPTIGSPIAQPDSVHAAFTPPTSKNLRGQAVRGGAVTGVALVVKLVLNVASTVLLARLLTPADYGLFAIVTGVTGIIEVFRDGGLSLATIQRDLISGEQQTTLFWLNVALGAGLMLLTLGLTPLITHLYYEPRLAGIMASLAVTFLIGGLGVQHQALLRRQLRFGAAAIIDIASISAGALVAVLLAWRGFGYWALVGMAISSALISTVAAWLVVPWRPGRAAPFAVVRPQLAFGGNIIGTRLVLQFVRTSPSILLGAYWGPVTVGIYQRAYALLMYAVDQIQGPVATVLLPLLSRLQKEPERQKEMFLSAYRAIVSLMVPIVVTCAVYSEEIVALMLGSQWTETAAVFRWLALGGIAVALNSSQGLLLFAMGRADICFRMGLIDAVSVVIGYAAGVRFGALGVAVGFCTAKLLLTVPLTVATFRQTLVGWRDIAGAVRAPLLASGSAALAGGLLKYALVGTLRPPLLAVVGGGATLVIYAAVLLFGARQWSFYRGLVAELRPRLTSALSN
jgi:O-antigen/teichoic acid export membrane protein